MGSLGNKRPLSESTDSVPKRAANDSAAARLNRSALRKLQNALAKDPEIDLISALPINYSSRLEDRKEDDKKEEVSIRSRQCSPSPNPKFPVKPEGEVAIIHPLSDTVKKTLQVNTVDTTHTDEQLISALYDTLGDNDIIWRSASTRDHWVAKICPDIVVKSSFLEEGYTTECTSLQYLETMRPELPIPRQHGLVTYGHTVLLFTSYIPGETLAQAWPKMNEAQKLDMRDQLEQIFLSLRALKPQNELVALGGVAGEGCKDTRRHTRLSKTPVFNAEEFFDFQYGNARCASELYLSYLRTLTRPLKTTNCVFTHGDVRTENILVDSNEGKYEVTGIIDWEMSGFYPADFECTKVTNTFATNSTDDWYLYIPPCISSAQFRAKWLADQVWDTYVV